MGTSVYMMMCVLNFILSRERVLGVIRVLSILIRVQSNVFTLRHPPAPLYRTPSYGIAHLCRSASHSAYSYPRCAVSLYHQAWNCPSTITTSIACHDRSRPSSRPLTPILTTAHAHPHDRSRPSSRPLTPILTTAHVHPHDRSTPSS